MAGNFTFGARQLHLVDYWTGLTEVDVRKTLAEGYFEVSEDCQTGHVTPANGNIFLDLGFSLEEAAQLKAELGKKLPLSWPRERRKADDRSSYIETVWLVGAGNR